VGICAEGRTPDISHEDAVAMFRITRANLENACTLRLEGTLTSREIGVLESAVAACAPAPVALDLAGLRSLDARGAACVRALARAGVRVGGESPFVAQLLAIAAGAR
jgi:hypothetical protein